MLNSYYRRLCEVALPYKGRQKYMHSFDLANPVMAQGFEDYLVPVTLLCRAAKANIGTAHMTVDEKIIPAGMSQRRPKPHVDGRYIPSLSSWGHDGSSGWRHYCNDVGGGELGRMAVIVASSVSGCRAWVGQFDAQPKLDGDLSHLELGEGEVLPANVGYLLSPDCVHESMIFERETQRTFLRIALPLSRRAAERERKR
jgi:hypothetical protein